MAINERLELWQRIDKLTNEQQARLEQIVLEHTRLFKEHIQPGTTEERKKEIRQQLLQLQQERKMLIGR